MASAGVDYVSNPGLPLDEKTTNEEKNAYDYMKRRASRSVKVMYDSTHRKLKQRHIQLIGIGGTIGTALYVQIGHGLLDGGPASLFVAFTIWCVPPQVLIQSRHWSRSSLSQGRAGGQGAQNDI